MRRALCLFAALACSTVAACGGCGDDEPGAADAGADAAPSPAPVLIARSPAPTDRNVWQRAPIVLEFDRPLDPTSVTVDAVRFEYDDLEVPVDSIELSADGRTVTATFTPLATPKSVVLAVTELLVGANGTPVEYLAWGIGMPVWYRAPLQQVGRLRPSVAAGSGVPYTAALAGTAANDVGLGVWRMDANGSWSAVGDELARGALSSPSLATRGDGSPVASWAEGGAVHVEQWLGDRWEALGAPGAGTSPTLSVGSDDAPMVALLTSANQIDVLRFGTDWQAVGSSIAAANTIADHALATRGTAPVVAYADGVTGDLTVTTQSAPGAAFDVVTTVDRRSPSRDAELALAADADRAYLAWVDDDGQRSHVAIAAIDADGTRRDFPGSIDLDLDAEVSSPALAASGGALYASWVEDGELWVARWNGTLEPIAGAWQVLGSDVAATDGLDATGARTSLAITADGDPLIAWRADLDLTAVARYNASPEVPRGLEDRAPVTTCAIPIDGVPPTLADTGCYQSLTTREPARELVHYDLRAPLWSDGAAKRRFVVVPDGSMLTRTDSGAWQIPVGTILVKEFWIESVVGDPTSLIPMETRFLVKRCEVGDCTDPWTGYSYQWNPEGTDGTLLAGDTAVYVDWAITDGGSATTHTHGYPSRAECLRCHNANAGFTLGLQTVQLERPMRYGDMVDDQLRAWQHIGLLDTVPATVGNGLPRPADPAHGFGERTRAYFHSNCSHCHQPGGERPTIDFRYDAALAPTNICNQLVVGDAASSPIYIKDATRPPDTPSVGGQPMPPLGTLLADDDQLTRTAAWIDGLASCP